MMNNQTNNEYADIALDIEKGYALNRLMKDKDFQMLFLDGYINDTLMDPLYKLVSTVDSERVEQKEAMEGAIRLRKYMDSIKDSFESAMQYEE